MAVDVTSGATFANDPKLLFTARLKHGSARALLSRDYDVTADGQRFLMTITPGDEVVPPITLVQNWPAALKR
jgi:hypothetical protein